MVFSQFLIKNSLKTVFSLPSWRVCSKKEALFEKNEALFEKIEATFKKNEAPQKLLPHDTKNSADAKIQNSFFILLVLS